MTTIIVAFSGSFTLPPPSTSIRRQEEFHVQKVTVLKGGLTSGRRKKDHLAFPIQNAIHRDHHTHGSCQPLHYKLHVVGNRFGWVTSETPELVRYKYELTE